MNTPMAAKIHAKKQLVYWGWAKTQWTCLDQLWTHESGWRSNAQNKTPVRVLKDGKWVKTYAGGIPQILGLQPHLSVPVQINRGLTYVKARYGSPCKAWKWWQRHYWY
jgi:hypothetical protein